MQYGMFTKQGDAAVHKIVVDARKLHEQLGYPVESAWNWALNELAGLAALEGCDEAEDTAVREAVYCAII
jgi:hypothetical protein